MLSIAVNIRSCVSEFDKIHNLGRKKLNWNPRQVTSNCYSDVGKIGKISYDLTGWVKIHQNYSQGQ